MPHTISIATFDVQDVNAAATEGHYATVECLFAHNSQARGCCVMSTTQQQLQPLVIEQQSTSNTASGLFGPLEEGTDELIIADLEKDSRQCSFSEVALRKQITIGNNIIGKLPSNSH